MRHDFLDRYSRLGSPLHRLPAGLKLAAGLAVVLVTVLLPGVAWGWFVAMTFSLAAAVVLSRVPVAFVFHRLLWLEPFVLGVSLLALLQPDGLRVFGTLVIKSTICLLTMIVVSSVTPFVDLLQVLRRLRVPFILVTTLALLYRYLFVLVDEAQRIERARASRTLAPSRRRTWRLLGSALGMLFVRSSERAERVYAAMLARGWR
jgi:cobalt/nickel transport system permease protein